MVFCLCFFQCSKPGVVVSQQVCSGSDFLRHLPLVCGGISVQSTEKTFEEVLRLFNLTYYVYHSFCLAQFSFI